MATDGTSLRRRSERLTSRVASKFRSSARSLEIRLEIRRRSVSSFVSPGPRPPMPTPPLTQVLQLRQLDLRLPFCTFGMSGEDVEDQGRAVDDLDLDPILEITQLGGSELSVADHGVRASGDDQLPQLVHLAPTDVGSRIRAGTPLNQSVKYLRTGRLCQQLQLGQ